MSARYLLLVSLAMLVIALSGLGATYSLRQDIAEAPGPGWPRGSETEQKAEVDALRAKANATTRFFAGKDAVVWFESPTSEWSTVHFFEKARLHATALIVMCWILAGCGVLGVARVKFARIQKSRGIVSVSVGVLALAVFGDGAVLFIGGAASLAAAVILTLVLAGFAQLIAVNLMPGPPHPLIAPHEKRLRQLPRGKRFAHVASRIFAGIGLVALGVVLTAATVALDVGRIVVVPTGLLVVGLFTLFSPLIALIRLRVQR